MTAAESLTGSGVASVRPDATLSGVLSAVRVLDMSRLVAGNMLSLQLADLGADVIKVESPKSGDTLRHWKEVLEQGGELDAWWRTYARNKRSLAVDLRDTDARQALLRLIPSTQILVESFRPGTLEAMGWDPDTLHTLNPGLIIVRVSGWGQSGPYRSLPGFGSLVEGFSGYAHKHASAQGVPQLPNMALADMIAGLTGAYAAMAALRHVEVNGGPGQVVDLSLLEPMLAIMGPDVSVCAATGQVPDFSRKIASPRNAYRCNDGRWVALSGSTDTMAYRVMDAIGRPELKNDPRFASNEARLENDAQLDAWIARKVAEMSLDECLAFFRAKGVTLGPVYDAGQLLDDPHIVQRASYVALEAGDSSAVMHNVTPRLSKTPGAIRRAAPRLGQHTEEILAEAGVDPSAIQALKNKGAIRCT